MIDRVMPNEEVREFRIAQSAEFRFASPHPEEFDPRNGANGNRERERPCRSHQPFGQCKKIANKMFSLLIVPNALTAASVKGRLPDDLPLGQLCAHIKEGLDLLVQHPLLLDTFLKGGDKGIDQLDSRGTVQLFLLCWSPVMALIN